MVAGWIGKFPRLQSQYLLLPTLLFITVCVIWPIGQMFSLAFLKNGVLSADHIRAVLLSATFRQVAINTIVTSLITAALSTFIAYPIALYVNRSKGRRFAVLMVVVLIPFWISILVRTLAWSLILGQNGVINSTLTAFGLTQDALALLYTRGAVIIAMVHAIAPISVLTILNAMQNIDPRLGTAAASLGASPARTFWLVYFPLTRGGVIVSFILAFVVSLGIFVQPALLGSPRETMVGQLIIQQIDELFNWNMAAAIAVVFLVIVLAVVIVADRIFGVSVMSDSAPTRVKSTGARGGLSRGFGRRLLMLVAAITSPLFRRDVARAREPALTISSVLGVAGLFWLAVPIIFLIPVSFTESNFLSWPPEGFTLRWYHEYLSSSIWIDATFRSIWVGVVTALLSTALGVPAAMALSRGGISGKVLIMGVILLPLVVPNILLALSMFYFFASLGLVGSDLGLVIGQAVFAVPYVVVAMIAAFSNYNWQLNVAAATLGASGLTAFWRITLPVVKMGVISAFIFAFVRSFDELTVALFISSGVTTTLPKRIWSEAHFNLSPTLAAVSTVLIVGVSLLVLSTELLTRRKKTPPMEE